LILPGHSGPYVCYWTKVNYAWDLTSKIGASFEAFETAASRNAFVLDQKAKPTGRTSLSSSPGIIGLGLTPGCVLIADVGIPYPGSRILQRPSQKRLDHDYL